MAIKPYASPAVEIVTCHERKAVGRNLALRVRLGQIAIILQGFCAIVFLLSVFWLLYGPPPFVVALVPPRGRGDDFFFFFLWPINVAMLGGFFFGMLTLFIGSRRQKFVSLGMLLFFASPFILLVAKETFDWVEVQMLYGH